jgi:hypothetical protein
MTSKELSAEARRAKLQRPRWDARHRDWGVADTSGQWEADPMTEAGTRREEGRGPTPTAAPSGGVLESTRAAGMVAISSRSHEQSNSPRSQ